MERANSNPHSRKVMKVLMVGFADMSSPTDKAYWLGEVSPWLSRKTSRFLRLNAKS